MNWTSECVAGEFNDVATIQGIGCIIRNLLSFLGPFLILVIVFVLIGGGVSYMTADGDPKKMAQIQANLTYAIIALVGIALAWVALTFIENLTGAPVTKLDLTL